MDAERYDRARPRYPGALVDRIVAAAPGPDVLDVGCGTGIAARQFQAACSPGARGRAGRGWPTWHGGSGSGSRLTWLRSRPGIRLGRTFDAVVAGQAWHWIDPVAGAAKAAQVLRPGGRLAAFWHVFDQPPEITEALVTVCRRVMPDSPFNLRAMKERAAMDVYQELFTKAADGIREVGGFSEPEQWRFDWEWSYTRDAWLDQMPTQGLLTQLPADRLAEVLEGVGAAIDAMGGSFTMRYATVAVTATRTGGAQLAAPDRQPLTGSD